MNVERIVDQLLDDDDDPRSEWQKRIGVGEPCHSFTTAKGRSPRRRDVIREEGADRGQVGGYQTDHPDGRMDATVFAPVATLGASADQ